MCLSALSTTGTYLATWVVLHCLALSCFVMTSFESPCFCLPRCSACFALLPALVFLHSLSTCLFTLSVICRRPVSLTPFCVTQLSHLNRLCVALCCCLLCSTRSGSRPSTRTRAAPPPHSHANGANKTYQNSKRQRRSKRGNRETHWPREYSLNCMQTNAAAPLLCHCPAGFVPPQTTRNARTPALISPLLPTLVALRNTPATTQYYLVCFFDSSGVLRDFYELLACPPGFQIAFHLHMLSA